MNKYGVLETSALLDPLRAIFTPDDWRTCPKLVSPQFPITEFYSRHASASQQPSRPDRLTGVRDLYVPGKITFGVFPHDIGQVFYRKTY